MVRKLKPLAAIAAVAVMAATPAWSECKLGKVAEIPVTMVGMQPTTTAKINGKDATLLIDSGAFYSILDFDFAQSAGLKTYARGGYMEGAAGVTGYVVDHVAKFEVGGASVSKADGAIAQLGFPGLDGLLGESILGQGDVEYDLANGVVRLFSPMGCSPNDDLAYWSKGSAAVVPLDHTAKLAATSFTDNSRWIRANVAINGQPITVVFDTGASRSILKQSAAARAGVTPTSPGATSRGGYRSGGGIVPIWRAPFKTLSLGEEEIGNVPIEFGNITLEGDMLLGADFFLSHRVYVANSQGRLYLTYNGGPVFTDGTGGAKAAVSAQDSDTPQDADGFRRRGAAFLARDDFPRAIADLDKAIALAPDSKTYLQRGLAHQSNNELALADADFDEAVKRDPTNFDAMWTRGSRRLEAKRFEEARVDLDALMAMKKPVDPIVLSVASLYSNAGRSADALAVLDRLLARDLDKYQVAGAKNQRCRALALLDQDLDKALADCNYALRIFPQNATVLENRALVRMRRGETDLALADYDASLKQLPGIAIVLYARGAARLKKGLNAEGQSDLAAAKAFDSKVGDVARRSGLVAADFDVASAP